MGKRGRPPKVDSGYKSFSSENKAVGRPKSNPIDAALKRETVKGKGFNLNDLFKKIFSDKRNLYITIGIVALLLIGGVYYISRGSQSNTINDDINDQKEVEEALKKTENTVSGTSEYIDMDNDGNADYYSYIYKEGLYAVSAVSDLKVTAAELEELAKEIMKQANVKNKSLGLMSITNKTKSEVNSSIVKMFEGGLQVFEIGEGKASAGFFTIKNGELVKGNLKYIEKVYGVSTYDKIPNKTQSSSSGATGSYKSNDANVTNKILVKWPDGSTSYESATGPKINTNDPSSYTKWAVWNSQLLSDADWATKYNAFEYDPTDPLKVDVDFNPVKLYANDFKAGDTYKTKGMSYTITNVQTTTTDSWFVPVFQSAPSCWGATKYTTPNTYGGAKDETGELIAPGGWITAAYTVEDQSGKKSMYIADVQRPSGIAGETRGYTGCAGYTVTNVYVDKNKDGMDDNSKVSVNSNVAGGDILLTGGGGIKVQNTGNRTWNVIVDGANGATVSRVDERALTPAQRDSWEAARAQGTAAASEWASKNGQLKDAKIDNGTSAIKNAIVDIEGTSIEDKGTIEKLIGNKKYFINADLGDMGWEFLSGKSVAIALDGDWMLPMNNMLGGYITIDPIDTALIGVLAIILLIGLFIYKRG